MLSYTHKKGVVVIIKLTRRTITVSKEEAAILNKVIINGLKKKKNLSTPALAALPTEKIDPETMRRAEEIWARFETAEEEDISDKFSQWQQKRNRKRRGIRGMLSRVVDKIRR